MTSNLIESIVESASSWLISGSQLSGKTGVLLGSIARLVASEKTQPENILFLPCTAGQTSAVRQRLSALTPFQYGYGPLHISRCGDFARRIVLKNGIYHNEITHPLRVDLFQSSKKYLVKHILTQCALPDSIGSAHSQSRLVEAVVDGITFLENTGNIPPKFKQGSEMDWFREVFDRYRQLCTERGFLYRERALDIATNLLMSKEKLLFPPIRFIFVDDYENLTPQEYAFIQALSKYKEGTACILAGNPANRMLAYRGSVVVRHAKLISDMQIPEKQVVQLPETRRKFALQESLRCLMNKAGLEDDEPGLSLVPDEDQSVHAVFLERRYDEPVFIASRIQSLLRDGYSPPEIAVFLPNLSKDAHLYYTVLTRAGIPCQVQSGTALHLTAVYQLVECVTALIFDPDNDNRARQFVRSTVFGVKHDEIGRMEMMAGRAHLSLFYGYVRYADHISDRVVRKRVMDVLLLMRTMQNNHGNVAFHVFIERLFSCCDLFRAEIMSNLIEANAAQILLSSSQFFSGFKTALDGIEPLLDEYETFKQWIIQHSVQGISVSDPPAVRILSANSGESFCFRAVFVCNVNNAAFPENESVCIPLILRNASIRADQFVVSSNSIYTNIIARCTDQLFLLYNREGGEMAPFFQCLSRKPFARVCENGSVFCVYDRPEYLTDEKSRVLYIRKSLLKMNEPEKDHIVKEIPIPFDNFSIKKLAFFQRVSVPVDYVFSATRFDDYLRCPCLFYYRHLLGIDTFEETARALFGKLMHSVLEILHGTYPHIAVLPEDQREDLLLFCQGIIKRILPAHSGINDFTRMIIMSQAVHCIERYLDAMTEELPLNIVAVEKIVNFRLDDIPFTAKIDRIDTHASGGVRIIDYKTSLTDEHTEIKLKNMVMPTGKETRVQLPVYFFAVRELMQNAPSELGIFYLQAKSKEGDHIFHKVLLQIVSDSNRKSLSRDELESIKQFILSEIHTMQSGFFVMPPPAQNCRDCDYDSICSLRRGCNAGT
ncbi:MAG: ATP-dependent helicase [Candidatus Auribacter fodinae]|jgi:CRISPR/Cas system-associated exonuclease Cas4 (RecB family)|uniref:ATP-dependent helicase n=1 Tax=Candidatus Auribacter fodinae TaxID=2093366 RepID=A0A3A4R2S2_9BACT|nr:MAG: ATP-dependent helicase [Candidatus Auribacter fodinae]